MDDFKEVQRNSYRRGLNDLLRSYSFHKDAYEQNLSAWRSSEVGSKEAEDFYESVEIEECFVTLLAKDISDFIIAYKDILFEE